MEKQEKNYMTKSEAEEFLQAKIIPRCTPWTERIEIEYLDLSTLYTTLDMELENLRACGNSCTWKIEGNIGIITVYPKSITNHFIIDFYDGDYAEVNPEGEIIHIDFETHISEEKKEKLKTAFPLIYDSPEEEYEEDDEYEY